MATKEEKAAAKAANAQKKADEKAAKKKAAEEKKAAEKAAKAAAKANAPKKGGRPAGNKARKYKDSAAGHFADVLGLIVNRMKKVSAKVGKWEPLTRNAETGEPVLTVVDTLNTDKITALIATLNTMAAAGFKPVRAKSTKPPKAKKTLAIGDRVTVNDAGMELLHRDFSSLTNEHNIIVAATFKEGDKAIPLIVKGDSSELYVGRVSKKFLTRVEPAATPAA